jgi:hypothetical protein
VLASYTLGGAGADVARGVAVSLSGGVYVTGSTLGSFPTAGGAFQTSYGGGAHDAFAAALDAALSTLTYSTYLGGSNDDVGYAVAVDVQGRATVAGMTQSTNFPTYQAFQGSNGGGMFGGTDGFVARLTATGTLSYSSYLGGSGNDEARGVALDPRAAAYVAGWTSSTDLPGTSGAYQAANAGGDDAFVAKILPRPSAPAITTVSSDTGYSASDRITNDQTLSITGTADPSVTVTLERAGVGVLGSVAANGSGVWTYTYSATLTEDTYAFSARANSSGVLSDYSAPEFLVSVDLTGPDVAVTVPSSTASFGPEVLVTARDRFGIPPTATVTLDVDLNNDGSFSGGELGYATGNLADGQATIKLPSLSSTGTYRVRARVTDLAGNEGTSSAATFTVSAAGSPWTGTSQVVSVTPTRAPSAPCWAT